MAEPLDLKRPIGPDAGIGREIHALITELFPICRSITGDGLRETLRILQKYVPIEIHEIPTGTPVFDWTVPKEWNIKDAYIKNGRGEKIVDFQKSNLHILNYSVPVRKVVSFGELKEHLITIPEHPDWIPYKTSYYREAWGFCLTHRQFLDLKEGEYEVLIDSSLKDGSLTYGELYLKGELEDEILISAHVCHPSLANDNLSGIGLATFIARAVQSKPHKYSYRFLFAPGTIGAIAWLNRNEEAANRIKHGLVLTGLGDSGNITYKKSRKGNAIIDRAAAHILGHIEESHRIQEFTPYGYDERQFCSPGFDLPVGRISRTPFGEYPEYHTSADNLDFVKPSYLEKSYSVIIEILNILENNLKFESRNQKCEPQLGRKGLYASPGPTELALLWVLNMSDGNNSLIDIAERSGMDFSSLVRAAQTLIDAKLLVDSSAANLNRQRQPALIK